MLDMACIYVFRWRAGSDPTDLEETDSLGSCLQCLLVGLLINSTSE